MPEVPLPHEFYDRDTVEVARGLLGRVLAHRTAEGTLAGVIVETEAYGPDDPASHAHRGPTRRNAAMFGPPGRAYIYLIYGMYWCVNAVTQPEGIGEAVLIRALEPLRGRETMRRNRGIEKERLLCSGPGRLCAALGITGALNGFDLTDGALTITGEPPTGLRIVAAPRVGVTQAADRLWRFYVAESPFISRK